MGDGRLRGIEFGKLENKDRNKWKLFCCHCPTEFRGIGVKLDWTGFDNLCST